MARIRSIKPEFWASEQIVECSTTARLLFIGIWTFSDDGGVMPLSLKRIKMSVFPGDSFQLDEIAGWLEELRTNGLIATFVDEAGIVYITVLGWKHQKIDKPSLRYPQRQARGSKSWEGPISSITRQPIDERSTSVLPSLGERPPAEGKGEDRSGVEGKGWNGEAFVDNSPSAGPGRPDDPASKVNGLPTEAPKPTPTRQKRKPNETPIPDNFSISGRVRTWAEKHGHLRIEDHLEAFVSKAKARAYRYADWDEAFMCAVREDWAKLAGKMSPGGPSTDLGEVV